VDAVRNDVIVDPTLLDATALVAQYRSGALSPVDVVDACLARIDETNPQLNAYVTVDAAAARATAAGIEQALRRGQDARPLAGVPVGIKDLTETAGMRTTYGSRMFADFVPDHDALVVQRLRAAGAVVIGKTNTPEFGAGGNTFNDVFGATRNPWDPALTCGGSSGGSAVALATGMSTLCEGSDLGGSLRTPAAFCGVVGFRTTPGLVPSWPATNGFDTLAVCGPMARSVADAALMLSVIAGPDDRAPLSYEVDTAAFVAAAAAATAGGLRVAFTPDLNGLIAVDAEVAGVCRDAMGVFEALGAAVSDDSPDVSDTAEIVRATRGLSMVVGHADTVAAWRDRMQPALVANIDDGLGLTAREIAAGIRKRALLWQRVRGFMERYDLLALPTVAIPPFPVEQPYPTSINGQPSRDYTQWFFLTYAITLTGLPAISIPCGFTRAGLPVGLQLVGRRRCETTVLAAAAAYEAAARWGERRPPVISAG
jgi:amidase